MMRIWISVLVLFLNVALYAQNPFSEDTPVVNGYDIFVSKPDFGNEMFYLTGNYGKTIYVVDSCLAKKGTLSFKNKKKIVPCGVYTITRNPDLQFSLCNPDTCLNIILNQSNRCTATWNNHVFQIDQNEESTILYHFLKKWIHTHAAYDYKSLQSLLHEYTSTSPNAFVSKYIMARAGYFAQLNHDNMATRCMLKNLSYTDLTEPRLLYAPIDLYHELTLLPENDTAHYASIVSNIDSLLHRCNNSVIQNYYLEYLFHLFDQHNPAFDPILIHLYDHYPHHWIEEDNQRRIARKIESLHKIVPGAKIPELIAHDKEGKAHSTKDITTKYTILWFWDPDCDHCQEMTPQLHDLYVQHASEANFEVFAVEINDDYDRWITFSDLHQLWDWTNLSTSMGEQNIDFIEYFDIMTTPVIYLIDNSANHTIIARQVSLDELKKLLEIQ